MRLESKRASGVDRKEGRGGGGAGLGLDPGPARKAGRQAGQSTESWDCIQRAKTQTALPASSPGFALQAASSPLFNQQTIPGHAPFPFRSLSLCCLLSRAPDSVLRMKQSATQSQFLFSLFFLSFLSLFVELPSFAPSFFHSQSVFSGLYTAEMVCSC